MVRAVAISWFSLAGFWKFNLYFQAGPSIGHVRPSVETDDCNAEDDDAGRKEGTDGGHQVMNGRVTRNDDSRYDSTLLKTLMTLYWLISHFTNKIVFLNYILSLQERTCGQFIGHPQTFVELQLHFKLQFYTKKMQFET